MIVSRFRYLRPYASIALFLSFAAAQLLSAPLPFDIPPQPAAAALQTFGRQAGMEVSYNAGDLKSVQSNEVKGGGIL